MNLTEDVAKLDKEIKACELVETLHSERARTLHDIGIKIQAIKTRLYEIDFIVNALNL